MSTKKNTPMIKKDFGKEILNKIKKEDIKQIPKHVFIIKHVIVWIFLFLSIFVGALSLSITFEYLINADWFLVHKLGIFKITMTFLPLFWLVFLGLASFLSYYNFKHTEKGYKYSFLKILLINIILSLILGIFIYLTGINHFIEGNLEKFVPKYRGILVENKETRAIKVWQNEESGLILGEIIKVTDNNFEFIDYNNKKWTVLLSKETEIRGRVSIEVGEKMKIMGEKKGKNTFNAFQIRPLNGRIKSQ
ncbi:MAG: hypothetical protein QM490_01450 [Candidatus Gracilibacteria bacterium]